MLSLGIWTERKKTYFAFDLKYSAKQFILIEKIIKEKRAVWKDLTHTHVACQVWNYLKYEISMFAVRHCTQILICRMLYEQVSNWLGRIENIFFQLSC